MNEGERDANILIIEKLKNLYKKLSIHIKLLNNILYFYKFTFYITSVMIYTLMYILIFVILIRLEVFFLLQIHVMLHIYTIYNLSGFIYQNGKISREYTYTNGQIIKHIIWLKKICFIRKKSLFLWVFTVVKQTWIFKSYSAAFAKQKILCL